MDGLVTEADRLLLGSAQWGTRYGIANVRGRPSVEEIERILAVASAAGVTRIDTARAYGDAEKIVGDLVGNDDAWQIVTKLHPGVSPDGASASDVLALARRSLEESRSALRRDVIDVLLLHRAGHRRAGNGALWEYLQGLLGDGTVRSLGISAATPAEALEALDDPDVGSIQVAASVLDRRLERTGFFQEAASRKKTVYVRSVFLQGAALLEPERLPEPLAELRPALHRLQDWAAANDTEVDAACLRYARSLPGVDVIVGCEAADQLARDLHEWGSEGLTRDQLEEIATMVPQPPDDVLDPARWPDLGSLR